MVNTINCLSIFSEPFPNSFHGWLFRCVCVTNNPANQFISLAVTVTVLHVLFLVYSLCVIKGEVLLWHDTPSDFIFNLRKLHATVFTAHYSSYMCYFFYRDLFNFSAFDWFWPLHFSIPSNRSQWAFLFGHFSEYWAFRITGSGNTGQSPIRRQTTFLLGYFNSIDGGFYNPKKYIKTLNFLLFQLHQKSLLWAADRGQLRKQ